MRTSLALAVLTTVVGLTAARAETKTFADARLQVELPAGWKVETKGEQSVASDPKGEVSTLFWVVSAADASKVLTMVDVDLSRTATNLQWGKSVAVTANGLKAQSRTGTATVLGKVMDLAELAVVAPVAGKYLVVAFVTEASKAAAHKAELKAITESVKALK